MIGSLNLPQIPLPWQPPCRQDQEFPPTARVPGTHIFVDYAVVEQYRTVLITGIHTVRWDMGEDID